MTDLERILLGQYVKEQEEKKVEINPVYCTKELGTTLYEDKLKAIGKYEKISLLIRRYINNNSTDENTLNDLRKEVKNKNILDLKEIKELGYDKEYLEKLNKLDFNEENGFYITNGITEKGYVEISNSNRISIDLQVDYGISIILQDIVNKILVKNRKPVKILSFKEADFINSLNINEEDSILQIGADLGYLAFKSKNVKKFDLYDIDNETINYLSKNLYPNIFDKNIINIVPIDKINISNYTKIILSPSLEEEYQMKLFYDLKLYNAFDKLYCPQKYIILNKFKSDFQDIIMTDRAQVEDSLIEAMKEMKGIGQVILSSQMDFVERAEKYINDNKLFFDSYKKWQKFIKDDRNILEILKSGD